MRTGTTTQKEQASVWLYVATEEDVKTRVLADLAANCVKLRGPTNWPATEKILQGLKTSFHQIGIEHFELTTSDD